MKLSEIINIDPQIQGGTPTFKGTRVPIQSLFWHIESGVTIAEFCEDFPSVSKDQAIQLLEISNQLFSHPEILKQYEITA